ncbi:hypothetical protein D3C73_963640 [compost metagenome]
MAIAVRATSAVATDTMKESTAIENMVPIPYRSQRLNSSFVWSKSRHRMKMGPKPTNNTRAIL